LTERNKNNSRMLTIRFLDNDNYNFVVSKIKGHQSIQLAKGKRMTISETLTELLKKNSGDIPVKLFKKGG